jgi:RimJ/RimL family protein N-acetyltransferase
VAHERTPIIRGERVWLRGFRETDLAAYERFVNSEDAQWAGYSLPLPPDKVKDWYQNKVRAEHGKDGYFFAVSPLGADDFIGTTWVWNLNSRIGGAEFSIFMNDPGRWGTGLGTDAANATTDFVFGFTDIERLWLYTMAQNERAQRSFEKVGFVKEGVLRGVERYRGQVIDCVLMAMLRSDWDKLDRPRSWDLSSH